MSKIYIAYTLLNRGIPGLISYKKEEAGNNSYTQCTVTNKLYNICTLLVGIFSGLVNCSYVYFKKEMSG